MTTPKRPAGQKLRTGSGAWERVVNTQQRSLVRAYDKWSVGIRNRWLSMQARGASLAEMEAFIRSTSPQLAASLIEVLRKGILASVNVAVGRVARNTPFVRQTAATMLSNAAEQIQTKLAPGIIDTMLGKLQTGELVTRRTMVAAFGDLRYRPANAAGGAWAAIFEVQKTVGTERNRERATEGLAPEPVRWVLDPLATHCVASPGFFGCPDLAGEYPGGWATLPTVPAGRTTCRGNDRCEIEVFVDGEWRRGFE